MNFSTMQAYHNQENPSLSLMLAFGGEVSMLERTGKNTGTKASVNDLGA
jgi:hypothetical protein